jgi:hypothetical protein
MDTLFPVRRGDNRWEVRRATPGSSGAAPCRRPEGTIRKFDTVADARAWIGAGAPAGPFVLDDDYDY